MITLLISDTFNGFFVLCQEKVLFVVNSKQRANRGIEVVGSRPLGEEN